MSRASTEYRCNRLTWPEMNDAIAAQKLVILPTGSTEQHGHHLPIDVDVFLCESVCLEVGRRAEGVDPDIGAVALGAQPLVWLRRARLYIEGQRKRRRGGADHQEQ